MEAEKLAHFHDTLKKLTQGSQFQKRGLGFSQGGGKGKIDVTKVCLVYVCVSICVGVRW